MRIVAGRLRRRQLLVNPGETTRPITDRAKVMLFDHIRWKCQGARVADLYAGTGSLGFEALSRGAQSVVFAEADHRAHGLLVQNAENLNVQEQVLCWRVDVLRCSFRPRGNDWTPYSLIFFDPPYAAAKHLARREQPMGRAIARLSRDDVSALGCWLVLRVPREQTIEPIAGWERVLHLEIASMGLHVLEKRVSFPRGGEETDEEAGDATPPLEGRPFEPITAEQRASLPEPT